MTKDKLNKKDLWVFVIPFLALIVLFGMITSIYVKKQINELLKISEESTINIADTYADSLINYREATDIVVNLLDEKILVASEAVLLLDDSISSHSLIDVAKRFQVDQINLYNSRGEILYSNEEDYVGWNAYEGHPVYDFMISKQITLVEDIRQDTENKKFYKYGYVKRNDNTFVQIGVSADNIHSYISKFEIEQVIENITKTEEVEQVFFIDKNFEILASSISERVGEEIGDSGIREYILKAETGAGRSAIKGVESFHTYAPIFYNNEWVGTLSIVWKSDLMDSEIKSIIFSGIIELFITIFVIGAILHFAYRKNKSNIKIAYYDTLTGLPNAFYMDEYLSYKIKNLAKNKMAVILINYKNFKILNATYGFKYGDTVLKQMAIKMKDIIQPNNMLFRFNADRFVLVAEDYKDKEELLAIAQEIIEVIRNPIYGGFKYEYVDAEIAIFEIHDPKITVDKILQDTTLALNNLIKKSNENIIWFDQDMEVDLKRKDKIESTIRDIISGDDRKSFYLEFQPKVDTKTNKVIGFEALARMTIDGLGNISPLEFIELAEDRLLIYKLGNHILERAIDFVKNLVNSGHKNLMIAVNLSAMQILRNEFLDDVNLLINESGIDTSMLEFELTESFFLDNFETINDKLEDIKKLGISIALDDFGTGFSSFSRLRDLKIDTVKIDQSFIRKISELDESDLLTADIISMSHKLGLNVVAEGVENEEQRTYLKKFKCDILQGFLISRPIKCKEALEFLKCR